jgi:hypothetical protein
MKKIILIIAVLLCSITSINAQTFTISQLKNVTWISHDIDYEEMGLKFSDTEYYDIVTYYDDNKTYCDKYPYYLSATKPTKFDSSLVGKNTKGKYVVVNLKKIGLWVFELKEVTKKKIVANFRNEKAIGGDFDIIYTFYKKQ